MFPGSRASKAVPLAEPKYTSFRHASHCLHLDEALAALHYRSLSPVRVTGTPAIIRSKILWFTLGFSNGHNMHGNVSFVTDWFTVTKKLGSNLYYIDQTVSVYGSCTRVLLTRSSYEGVLQRVDNIEGSPIIEKMGQPFHVVRCQNKKKCDGPHELKLAVEADESEARWLFTISYVLINDHFFVNLPTGKDCKRNDGRTQRYKPHKCFKYNSFLNALCPFQFRREDVECKLREECPWVDLCDTCDLAVIEEEIRDNHEVEPPKKELSQCEKVQESPGIFQYYNCLQDPKKMSSEEASPSELNMTEICTPEANPSSDEAANASSVYEAPVASKWGQYHRYRTTKEDDAFQQATLVSGHSLIRTAAGDASKDMLIMVETPQLLPRGDHSAQISTASEGQSQSADDNVIGLSIGSDWNKPSLRSSNDKETKLNEMIEPKLEIDLMKMALDDFKDKLLKLEKAITQPSQRSSTRRIIEISDENFIDVLPKIEDHKSQSEANPNLQENVFKRCGRIDPKPVSGNRNVDGSPSVDHTNTPSDRVGRTKPPEGMKYPEQTATPHFKVSLSSRVSSGGWVEDPPGTTLVADRTRQSKRSSTLYRSTLSSAVKAKTKSVVSTPKKT